MRQEVRLPPCLCFDLDGTLLDSLPGIAQSVTAALRAAGLPGPAHPLDLRSLIGPPIREILGKAAKTGDPALLDELERHFRDGYDSRGWRDTPCFPGAPEALRALRDTGRRLFVVSNKPRHISLKILQEHGIAGLFEDIYTRDSRRPPYASKQEMLEALLTGQALAPAACAMVGDTMEDAHAAASLGVAFIFMEHGYGQLPGEYPALLRLAGFSDFLPHLAMEKAQ